MITLTDKIGARTSNRVALITSAGTFVGPALAQALARDGHDLVLCDALPGQDDHLRSLGAELLVLDDRAIPPTGPGSLATLEGNQTLVRAAVERFGRLDAVALTPPTGNSLAVTQGPFQQATLDQLRDLSGYLDSTFCALQAFVPALTGGAQIVVFTSDAGTRPEPGWSIYGAIRAAQGFLVQAVALEHASSDIAINVIATKNAVGPGFPFVPPGTVTDSSVERGPWTDALEAETPLKRLGTMTELAAFASVLLDGRNRFQTAQIFSYSGGWNVARGGLDPEAPLRRAVYPMSATGPPDAT